MVFSLALIHQSEKFTELEQPEATRNHNNVEVVHENQNVYLTGFHCWVHTNV